MECWSELVVSYPEDPEPKHLANAVRTATTLLATDLAPFEIEWLVQTLLYKPIDILHTVLNKKSNEDWFKTLSDCFKLLGKLSSKHWNIIDDASNDIYELCMLPFDAKTRAEAMLCLNKMLSNPGSLALHTRRLLHALDNASSCKAPLALVVGSLCRYHPESVDRDFIRIWRIYLRMLQPTNRTDTVVSAVLQGIDGLFENFGTDISIQEINEFYIDFSRRCVKIPKCIDPLLSILKTHADLFKERLERDILLRMYVWGIHNSGMKDALLSIYRVIFEDLAPEKIREIIKSEIEPKLNSSSTRVKHTALHILLFVKSNCGIAPPNLQRPDELELNIRRKPITRQEADLVSLFLQSNENYKKSLLLTVIIYYQNIPDSMRMHMVVKTISTLYEEKNDRVLAKVAVAKLIDLSVQNGLETFYDVWRGLLQPEKENVPKILRDCIDHVICLIKTLLEAPIKDAFEALSVTSILTFFLCVSDTEDEDYAHSLRLIIEELSDRLWIDTYELLQCKFVCAEMFKDNDRVNELRWSWKSPPVIRKTSSLQKRILDLKIILSDNSVNTNVLSEAVSKLTEIIQKLDRIDEVDYVVKLAQKLKYKKDSSTKDNRILHHSINMCLGKRGHLLKKEDFEDDVHSFDLKNKLMLNIPNIAEGLTYKMDLLRILQISLMWKDEDVLYCLLVIIAASLRDRPDSNLEIVAWRLIAAVLLCGDADVTPLLRVCASEPSVRRAVRSIREEADPEVRRRLCDCLQTMVQQNPGSDTSAELLRVIGNEIFLKSDLTVTSGSRNRISERDVGDEHLLENLDISRVFINNLQQNHDLTLEYLPKIVIATSRCHDKELFKLSTSLFSEKIDIFNDDVIKNVFIVILKCMIKDDEYVEFHKKYVLEFLKPIFEMKRYSFDVLTDEVFRGIQPDECSVDEVRGKEHFISNILQILSLLKTIYLFDEDFSKMLIQKHNYILIRKIMQLSEIEQKESDDESQDSRTFFKNMLIFLTKYATALLNVQEKMTLECLKKITKIVIQHGYFEVGLSDCLCTYKTILKKMPIEITSTCIDCLNDMQIIIQNLTKKLEPGSNITGWTFIRIRSLYIISKIFNGTIPGIESWTAEIIKSSDKIIFEPNTVVQLLEIAETQMTMKEFEVILKKNPNFVKKYMSVYFEKVLGTSEVLEGSVLLDVLKFSVQNYKLCGNRCVKVLEVVEQNWPTIREDFELKLSIVSEYFKLLKMGSIERELECVTQWVTSVVVNPDVVVDDKIKMITALHGGQKYSTCYRHMAGLLPTRISEVRGDSAAVLRALLDSLSTTGDDTLLDIVVTLSAGDDTKGWWDYAIDSCMAELKHSAMLPAVYQACSKRPSIATWMRVFVPLLRHSPRGICEEFISTIISDILAIFKTGFKEPSNSEFYRERILSYTRAFIILQVVFEKLPPKNLESGVINRSAGSQDLWFVVKQACQYSVTLRDKVQCPDDADDALRDACLRMQCAAYNCLTTAICKRTPSQKQYTCVFDVIAWSKIVDVRAEYEFQARSIWDEHSTNKPSEVSSASTSSFTSTARTKMFMGTLSENPLQYDMIPLDEKEEELEEDNLHILDDHPLDSFGCLSVITSLLKHSSSLEHSEWVGRIVTALESDTLHANAKWMLAQAICNVEEDLKPHASVFAPALLVMIASTSKVVGDVKVLNNLHIDVLWTIIKWKIQELPNYTHLNICVETLITSYFEYKSEEHISKRLLNTLNSILETYKTNVEISWQVFETHCNGLPDTASYLLPILQRILKNGIPLPNVLPIIFAKFDAKLWDTTSKLPAVFGMALSLESIKEEYLDKFWQVLASLKADNIRGFVKVLLNAQRECAQCCNQQYFRIITDLAPKTETSKCLLIISVYLENLKERDGLCDEMFDTIGLRELLHGDHAVDAMKVVRGGFKFMNEQLRNVCVEHISENTRNNVSNIRQQAFKVIIKIFQDITEVKDEHPSKRRALDTTPLLATMHSTTTYHRLITEGISRGLFDNDQLIAKDVRETLELCLSKEIAIRFVELFYVIFYLTKNVSLEMTEYGYMFLDLLFKDLIHREGFKNVKLSDQPLPPSDVNVVCLTNTSGKLFGQKKTGNVKTIDVQMPVADILEMLVKSAKMNPVLSASLCALTSVMAVDSGRRFDARASITAMSQDILLRGPNCQTPVVLDVLKTFFDGATRVEGLKDSLSSLKRKVVGSDAVDYCNVVYEEVVLRTEGRNLFDFSVKEELDIEMRNEDQDFTVTGLTKTFGDLSNWDDLRIGDRNRIEEFLPPMFADRERFESAVQYYFVDKKPVLDYSLWFNKLLGSYMTNKLREPIYQCKENWLNDVLKWPRSVFVDSCIMESIQWYYHDADVYTIPDQCVFNPSECLAEWAGRLMLRTAFHSGDNHESDACLEFELEFCQEAVKRRLPHIALQCIERNKEYLQAEKAMPWFEMKVTAQRMIALKQNNTEMLQRALEAVEQQDTGNNLCLKKLTMQLRNDLGILTSPKLENVITKEYDYLKWRSDLTEMVTITLNYYYDLWDASDISTQESILIEITNVIARLRVRWLRFNVFSSLYVAMLLHRMACFKGILSQDTAKKLLQEIDVWKSSNFIEYDPILLQLNTLKNIFPAEVWSEYMFKNENESLDTCKQFFKLICDPQYAMIHFCDTLLYTKDPVSWQNTFRAIKDRFNNKFGGTEYISLSTIKNKLLSIEHCGEEEKRKVLISILDEFKSKPHRGVLRLSQLCPDLCRRAILENQKNNLKKLLALTDGYVFKIHEQVPVFTDSIRRPCVVTVVLTNGKTKRYIIKTGEPLSVDSSMQRAVAVLPKIYNGIVKTYNVTTLSEDSAIIEYLEGYKRLRELMGDRVDIPVNRLDDDKLALSPGLALEQYNAMCNKVPIYTLRSAIESRCTSIEEFIKKKRCFLETLASMTITNWIFGVGDRHLHNIMMNSDGGICGIDWASAFEFGKREYMPARLTANVLAVCDIKVLESRLQSLLGCLRENHRQYAAYISMCFYWKRDFKEMTYISNILKGKSVSYEITRLAIETSNQLRKDDVINVLDSAFENFDCKESYSVEEQITCLLQHCTNPKLLSIIPRGWEPWV